MLDVSARAWPTQMEHRRLYAARIRSWQILPNAPSPFVLARHDRTSAMRASDAGVVLIVKWIVRNLMGMEIAPDLLVGPIGDGVDLDQPELCIPFNLAGTGASGGLLATDAADPGGHAPGSNNPHGRGVA